MKRLVKIKGWELDFFNSGEWQVCDERLKDIERISRRIGSDGYNPGRKSLFKALQAVPEAATRVALFGQDPYPQAEFATGLAFSIPAETSGRLPPTLSTVFDEYESDLHYGRPKSGDLGRWAAQGVLLWNVIPSTKTGQSLSQDWDEWTYLTREIIHKLNKRRVVYALLGTVARRYLNDIDTTSCGVLVTSHPSPRGSRSSNTPFVGSRIFSAINDKLSALGQSPIDWRLP